MKTRYEPGTTFRHALARDVLVVARIRHDGWKAYVFPVPGENHEREQELWREHGTQIIEPIARECFGFLEDVPYAH